MHKIIAKLLMIKKQKNRNKLFIKKYFLTEICDETIRLK